MRKPFAPFIALLLISGLNWPGLAWAHSGGTAHDVLHGFLHPLTGLDHILAMVSVGLLAAQRGGRALWLLPLSFVSMMALGGFLGASGVALPGVETAVGLSVIVLGGLILSGIHIPAGLAALLAGAFAVFHGHAHGTEIPIAASSLTYGLAFMTATALLHGLGITLYVALMRGIGPRGAPILRMAGGTIALAGVGLVLGLA